MELWTQADVDALKAAIASGVKRVRYANNREVEYQDTDQMQRVLAGAVQAVNAAAGTPTYIRIGTRKGFGSSC